MGADVGGRSVLGWQKAMVP